MSASGLNFSICFLEKVFSFLSCVISIMCARVVVVIGVVSDGKIVVRTSAHRPYIQSAPSLLKTFSLHMFVC